jgi:hypothetical protein
VKQKARNVLLDALENELKCKLLKQDRANQMLSLVETTISSAIAFAQMVARQRTVYQVYVPDVTRCQKDNEGEDLTNVDDEFVSAPEDEESGAVWYVGYPGLMKWGDSVGQRMTEGVVLIPPFVVLQK